tara:strand:- start:7 stop:132 length:126 start_codon:yes stop_codon:yes gene_type:complete
MKFFHVVKFCGKKVNILFLVKFSFLNGHQKKDLSSLKGLDY